MSFIADLHIHSRYSRATSKSLSFETLYQWAKLKGVSLVGTGDFTHPAWLKEIKEKLVPDGKGLFKLKDENIPSLDIKLPSQNLGPIRFMITGEISNIYKYAGKTRKVHNLICMPDFDSASRFANRLDRIGNIRSDGRPILGLDSRDLLETLLETSEDAVLIPAHIWTPWFSVLGSKSGFDSIEECYRDLSHHIFALETGLSSDPPMNWMVSKLDRYALVSNSDAHSASNIGREANLFDCEVSYDAIMNALRHRSREDFLGTLEFFPQEGKYHYDGHRKCDVCLSPEESRRYSDVCPKCGRLLTLGVMHRVVQLADYPIGRKSPSAFPYKSVLSLDKILSEIIEVGSKSKKVQHEYRRLISSLGPELSILLNLPLESIRKYGSIMLAEAIKKVREGMINASPGFDGQYGTIQVLTKKELNNYTGQTCLFSVQKGSLRGKASSLNGLQSAFPAHKSEIKYNTPTKKQTKATSIRESDDIRARFEPSVKEYQQSEKLNDAQQEAVESSFGPLLVVAGPGTGKTKTLVERAVYLIIEKSIPPESILAVTFSNRAAREMAERVEALLSEKNIQKRPEITTFHKLGLKIISENYERFELKKQPVVLSEGDIAYILSHVGGTKSSGDKLNLSSLEKYIISFIENGKDRIDDPEHIYEQIGGTFGRYNEYKRKHRLIDFTDLLLLPLSLLSNDQVLLTQYRQQWQHILVDEYQDINALQYRLLRLLAPSGKNLFVIGDPDQAIYGFRGADVHYFTRFKDDYPDAHIVTLTRSYRSTDTILKVSSHMISSCALADKQKLWSDISGPPRIDINRLPTENSEAENVLKTIEKLIGGSSYFAVDTGRSGDEDAGDISFKDIAVLYRVHSVGDPVVKALARSGIPIQRTTRTNILGNKEIQATLACLKFVEEPHNIFYCEDLLRFGIPDISNQSASRLIEMIHSGFSDEEDIFDWLKKSGKLSHAESQAIMRFEGNIENVVASLRCKDMQGALRYAGLSMGIKEEKFQGSQYLSLIERAALSTNLPEFLAAISLDKDTDFYDPRAEGVTLMTLHASKGLEWKAVFIVGCEEGLIPYNEYNKEANLDEERRLFYVGMTRAKQHLFLSYAESRMMRGKKVKRQPSSFLDDIPADLEDIKSPFFSKKAWKNAGGAQLELFK